MQPDLEYLIWLYSIGVEEIINEVPVNQFGENPKDYISNEKFKKQEIIKVKDKNNYLTKISEEINQLTDVSDLENYFKNFLTKNPDRAQALSGFLNFQAVFLNLRLSDN